MPKPPRTDVLPRPKGSYAKLVRGPLFPLLVSYAPRESPTNNRCRLLSSAAAMRPFAFCWKDDPKNARPLYGSPVPGVIDPSDAATCGAFALSNRSGRNVEVLPKTL